MLHNDRDLIYVAYMKLDVRGRDVKFVYASYMKRMRMKA